MFLEKAHVGWWFFVVRLTHFSVPAGRHSLADSFISQREGGLE